MCECVLCVTVGSHAWQLPKPTVNCRPCRAAMHACSAWVLDCYTLVCIWREQCMADAASAWLSTEAALGSLWQGVITVASANIYIVASMMYNICVKYSCSEWNKTKEFSGFRKNFCKFTGPFIGIPAILLFTNLFSSVSCKMSLDKTM